MARRKIGAAMMLLGILLLLGAVGFVYENRREESSAAQASQMVLEDMQHSLMSTQKRLIMPGEELFSLPAEMAGQDEAAEDEAAEDELREAGQAMPTMTIDGREYIGYIEMPTLGLSLPVMNEWSYPKLRIAPCRYWGSVYDGSLVILAHNYDRHFGRLAQLGLGDPVQLVAADGSVYAYEVAALETLERTDIDAMLSGEYDLTLFTCTPGGQKRVTVRLTRVWTYD